MDDIRQGMQDLILRFGRDYVIGYICCSTWIIVQKAKECHCKGDYKNRDRLCDTLMEYIEEYERITGETAHIDDMVTELEWWPSRIKLLL